MNSVFQYEKECYVCKTTINIHCHHIYGGNANRKISEKYGYKIYLCMEHHTGNNGVHHNKEMDLKFKRIAQRHFEDNHGTRKDFIKIFGRSYLHE